MSKKKENIDRFESRGKQKEKKGHGVLIAIIILAVVIVIVAVAIFFVSRNSDESGIFGFLSDSSATTEEGLSDDDRMSNGETALLKLQDVGGESTIVTVASLTEAAASGDPAEYLANNSEYDLDDEAIQSYTTSYVSAAESTADAEGITVDELIVEWGYEDLDEYTSLVYDMIEEFVKERLAIYTVAEQEGITISEEEYESMLDTYAAEYGYDDAETFEYECYPQSIANEMLFDTTVEYIINTH